MAVARNRPLKVGLILPDTERQMNGETARWADFRAMAREAETVGFDSLWVTDHLIHRAERGEQGPWECWSLISALAAVTEQVEIGTLVLCAGFRNPAHLAKMADAVDEISGGRLILGLGAGWNEAEYRAFGYPFDHRVDRFEEAMTIVTGLLRDGRVDFKGTYAEAIECVLRPRGPRLSGPPILIGTGGSGMRMLGLTAKFADQWNVWFGTYHNRVNDLAEMQKSVDEACREAGRDPATLERTAAVMIEVGAHNPSQMSSEPITGAPTQIAAELRRFAEIGVSHVQVWLEPNNLDGIRAFGTVLETLASS
jgi:probable F420-dependent oxidoreductase